MTQQVDAPAVDRRAFTWTLERYHRMIELGILTPEDRVELLFGQIVEKMSIGEMHAACVKVLSKYFNRRYLDVYELMQENPVTLPNESEPEPDFAIVDLKEDNYKSGHPTPADIHLVIEVADNTLDTDRRVKSVLYALAGIPEYWIINLKQRQVEVYLKPDTAAGTYGSLTHYREEAAWESPFAGSVAVKDLLP